MSVHPYACNWTTFHWNRYVSIFRKCVSNVQVLLKSDKKNKFLTWRVRVCTFLIVCLSVLLRMRNISDTICRENQNIRFMFSNFSIPKSCRLWENVGKYGRANHVTDDDMIWRMRIAYIYKARNTHSKLSKEKTNLMPLILLFYSVFIQCSTCFGR